MTIVYRKLLDFGGGADIIESACIVGSSFTSARLCCCGSGAVNLALEGVMLIRAAGSMKKIFQPT